MPFTIWPSLYRKGRVGVGQFPLSLCQTVRDGPNVDYMGHGKLASLYPSRLYYVNSWRRSDINPWMFEMEASCCRDSTRTLVVSVTTSYHSIPQHLVVFGTVAIDVLVCKIATVPLMHRCIHPRMVISCLPYDLVPFLLLPLASV